MKYFEILYLAAAAFLAALLVQQYGSLDTTKRVMLVVGIVIFSFMYSFRRSQRQRMERHDNDKDKNA